MTDPWTLIRFVHILGAVLWVGGQLTISLVVLPPARRVLGLDDRAAVLTAVGHRFARITLAGFVPLQIATGWLMAEHNGVTWSALLEPGYGRLLAIKLVLFVLVMVAAAAHGILQARGKATSARASSALSLIGSVVIVWLAAGLATGAGA